MHRTFSMRQSRAPTASQLENPLPPTASTKGNHLFKNSIGNALKRSKSDAKAPDLSKKLAELVKSEKNTMRSMESVAKSRMEVAKQLSLWGEHTDSDVSDITDKIGVLLYEIGELEDQYIDRHDQYRVALKRIRDIEASVQPCFEKRQKLEEQIMALKFKEPGSNKLMILEQELVRAEAVSLVAQAQLSNTTRQQIKSAFHYHFDALKEHSEKVALISSYGKHLLDLLDDHPVTPGENCAPYDGYEASRAIIQDCEDALTNWVSSNAAVHADLSPKAMSLSQRRRRTLMANQGQLEMHQSHAEPDQQLIALALDGVSDGHHDKSWQSHDEGDTTGGVWNNEHVGVEHNGHQNTDDTRGHSSEPIVA